MNIDVPIFPANRIFRYVADVHLIAITFSYKSRKHFLKQPELPKHFFETKTSPRFPLFLSEHAEVVQASWGSNHLILFLTLARFAFS